MSPCLRSRLPASIPGRRILRSVAHLELTVPRIRTMTSGPRAFPVCGPLDQRSGTCCRAHRDHQTRAVWARSIYVTLMMFQVSK